MIGDSSEVVESITERGRGSRYACARHSWVGKRILGLAFGSLAIQTGHGTPNRALSRFTFASNARQCSETSPTTTLLRAGQGGAGAFY
jgi:hypothetical protein